MYAYQIIGAVGGIGVLNSNSNRSRCVYFSTNTLRKYESIFPFLS